MKKPIDEMVVKPTRVVNQRDVDITVRDFYGREHVLFPKMEKELMILTKKEDKDDRR